MNIKGFVLPTALTLILLPGLSHSEQLNDAELSKLLASLKTTESVFKQVEKDPAIAKEMKKTTEKYAMKGKLFTGLTSLLKNKPDYKNLQETLKNSGYKSVESWEDSGNRMMSVMTAGLFVNMSVQLEKAIKEGGSPDLESQDVLFKLLADEQNDSEQRKKYMGMMEKMCQEEYVCNKEDINVVVKNYKAVNQVLKVFKN